MHYCFRNKNDNSIASSYILVEFGSGAKDTLRRQIAKRISREDIDCS